MIDIRIEDGVRIITLSRPDKRNALTPDMLEALVRAVNECTERALLLRGEGRVFCAGFDLTLSRDDHTILPRLLAGLSQAIRALRAAGPPVVIAAHAAAIAGGCALLGGADFVITNHDAKLGYPVLLLGISPAVSGPSLIDTCGDRRARELMLHPRLISGADALRMGLVAESLPDPAAVDTRAHALARELAAKPPVALARTRAWLNTIESHRRSPDAFDVALDVSLGLVDGAEGRRMLAAAWTA